MKKKLCVTVTHTRQDITKILGAGGELTSIVLVMYIIIGNQKETKKFKDVSPLNLYNI